jgi:LAS superfamily LD-carboxypeptidase LdcB
MLKSELFGIDNSALCPVASTGHFLSQNTAMAFQLMLLKAQEDAGITIGIASSYRSFERQKIIWNRKYRGETTTLDNAGKPIANWLQLSSQERIFAILRWSALPGASRHHWGTDLDVYAPDLLPSEQKLQLIPAEYEQSTGYFAPLTQWLNLNMHKFGFFRPYDTDRNGVAPEPWHISYYPEAKKLQQQLSINMMHDLLLQYPIEGNTDILELLPLIWDRFVININEEQRV